MQRRRLLQAAGGSTVGAALLAACGGGESGSSGTNGEVNSSLVSQIADESKAAKKGGVMKFHAPFEYVHLDPQQAAQSGIQPLIYSTLWRIEQGFMTAASGEVVGDVFESWEFSPDKLTLTAKVNSNAHFAQVNPVNGRSVTADDVVKSYERWKSVGTYASEVNNAATPDAPLISMTNTDDKTVVMKLNEPNSTLIGLLTQTRPGNFFVVPKEAMDQKLLDIRTTVAGSGPWSLKDWRPGQGIYFKRNPGFRQDKRQGTPYMDEVEYPTITELSVGLAQFKAGNIYLYDRLVAEDILPTKRDLPQLELKPTDLAKTSQRIIFGHLPNSPFKDERVRQAWMMTHDRDALIDVMHNVSGYKREGIDVQTAWCTAIQCDVYKGWWLDPQGKEFGENAKYFKHDNAEAKKLLAAAGFANGVDTTVHYPGSNYPATTVKVFEISLGMVRDSGLFRFGIDLVNYNTEWTPKFRNSRGQIQDVAMINEAGTLDPTVYLYTRYHSSGAGYQGGDSTLDDLLGKAVREFDTGARQKLLYDVQRREARSMNYPLTHGGATGFQLSWPVLRNVRVFQGGSGRLWTNEFLDPTKAPLGKA
jgi:peptide/nickel transport system substrate-binding protein